MRDLGIKQTQVLFAKDNTQMISYLREGKVDWVTETLFSAVFYREKARAEILLRKWRKGASEYYTVFFTQKGSGIDSLEDLKGKMIAFEDPGVTTAFYVPASVLISEVSRVLFLEPEIRRFRLVGQAKSDRRTLCPQLAGVK
jgi:phosphonate transport system substrate-binding protein